MHDAPRDPSPGMDRFPSGASGAPQAQRPSKAIAGVVPFARRPLFTRLIVIYKLVRVPVMVALAGWLTVAPASVFQSLGWIALELEEAGAESARVGAWIQGNVTSNVVSGSAVLVWLDAASTAIEGLLLLSGRTWAEWIVIAELACLLPFEFVYLTHRPGLGRLFLLVMNALIVLYLVRGRVRAQRTTVSAR